jgi:hypothetical protein
LNQGELYLITDEDVLAVGISTSTYEDVNSGSFPSFRNRIINGNLSNPINQRGAGSITASTGYTYDRWYYDGTTYLHQGIEDKNVNNGTYVISWEGSGINAAWKVSTDTTANNGPDATTGFTSVSNGGTFTVNEGTEYSKHLWIRFDGTLANLDKVQVEEGTVATPFEHRPTSVELSLAQRYYQKSYLQGTVPGTVTRTGCVQLGSYSNTATTMNNGVGFRFPVVMRAAPTMTGYDPDVANTTGQGRWDASGIPTTQGALTFGVVGDAGVGSVLIATTGRTAGAGLTLIFHYTASVEL